MHKCTKKRVVKWTEYQHDIYAIPTQEKKIQQRKGSHSRDKSEQTKGAEGAADGMQPIGKPSRKQQNTKKKAVSANRMNKQQVKSDLRRTMFQQKKRAEDLANGMDVRSTALEKLGYKVIEEEIIVASAKAAGDEAATWAAKCAEQKPKFPSRTPCYSVSDALQASPASKIQQQENQQLELEERVRAAAVTVI